MIEGVQKSSLVLKSQLSLQEELKKHFHTVLGYSNIEEFVDLYQKVRKSMYDSIEARVFWLSFFKTEMACPAIEFFEKIKLLCTLNDVYEIEVI